MKTLYQIALAGVLTTLLAVVNAQASNAEVLKEKYRFDNGKNHISNFQQQDRYIRVDEVRAKLAPARVGK